VTRIADRGCSRAQAWASLELDGELSQLESVLLERHLERCAGCAARVHDMRGLADVLCGAPLERPSAPVFVASPRRLRAGSVAARVAVAATLALAAGGLGVLAGSLGGDGGTEGPVEQELVFLTPDDLRDVRGLREQPEQRDPRPAPRLGGV
jgi:predicted anti-sigma-YlaC factor YlaD